MTKENLRTCKRLFEEKDAAENDAMWMENLVEWFSKNPKSYDLRLLAVPVDDVKRIEVSISHCFTHEVLNDWLKQLKHRAEKYKAVCDGLKWQEPILPKETD